MHCFGHEILAFRAFRACLRAFRTPLQVPLPFFAFLEWCCQFGIMGFSLVYTYIMPSLAVFVKHIDQNSAKLLKYWSKYHKNDTKSADSTQKRYRIAYIWCFYQKNSEIFDILSKNP